MSKQEVSVVRSPPFFLKTSTFSVRESAKTLSKICMPKFRGWIAKI